MNHEQLRQCDSDFIGLTAGEASELLAEFDAVVAENAKLRFDLSMGMHAPSLPDDDEPITKDWWDNTNPHHAFNTRSNAELMIGRDEEGVYFSFWEGSPMTLPAVRTRGDVRQLVRLLGRE